MSEAAEFPGNPGRTTEAMASERMQIEKERFAEVAANIRTVLKEMEESSMTAAKKHVVKEAFSGVADALESEDPAIREAGYDMAAKLGNILEEYREKSGKQLDA